LRLQKLELIRRYAGLGQQAKSRIDAVCGVADGDDFVDQGAATAIRPRSYADRRSATGCS